MVCSPVELALLQGLGTLVKPYYRLPDARPAGGAGAT